MKTYAFIFARGGSKGLPGKNIRPLCGKPLIEYAIDTAFSVQEIQQVFVSTDDHMIADVAKKRSAIVIDRPEDLATDQSPEWQSWQHAMKWVTSRFGTFDTFVSLPPTSPLRSQIDVENCLNSLNEETDCVVGITESKTNPWFNMVRRDSLGYLQTICVGDYPVTRRQDAPKTFDITTVVYAAKTEFILSRGGIFDGRVKGVEIPRSRAIDIDTIDDFKYAEFCLMTGVESK